MRGGERERSTRRGLPRARVHLASCPPLAQSLPTLSVCHPGIKGEGGSNTPRAWTKVWAQYPLVLPRVQQPSTSPLGRLTMAKGGEGVVRGRIALGA